MALVSVCGFGCLPAAPSQLWRSRDGDVTWVKQTLPADNNGADPSAFDNQLVWVGGALFAQPNTTVQLPHDQAVSISGGAFTWISTARAVGALTTYSAYNIFSLGKTLIINLYPPSSCATCTATLSASSDLGQTWTVVQEHGAPAGGLSVAVAGADGVTLLSYANSSGVTNPAIYRSTDGGVTWRAFPLLPSGGSVDDLVESPDGAWYGVPAFEAKDAPGLYRLAPGSATWVAIGPPPFGNSSSFTQFMPQVDGAGHAQRVWTNGDVRPTSLLPGPPLAFHAP